ncbi:MAG: glycine cleavage system protein H, partial [Bacteroidaceae bacterium]|nr:glycine cleavage system protein H [Bacteroidaceae bacterium]
NPELVNQDPYGEGWLIKIKPNNAADIEGLLDAAAYQATLGE